MRAIDPEEAAALIGRQFGLVVTAPVTLADSNNIVVWLAPSPVVAKIGTGHHRALRRELDVAGHLVEMGAPVVGPAVGLPQLVHHVAGFDVTFWRYQPHQCTDDGDPAKVGRALLRLHNGLATYTGPLPSYEDELTKVNLVLTDEDRSPALELADRRLLLSALTRFRDELSSAAIDHRPLHGSPHSANMLIVDGEPRFIDFETACWGPVEWDLAHLGADAAAACEDVADSRVLALCTALVSVKTAAWCWARIEHPDLRWHATHLGPSSRT